MQKKKLLFFALEGVAYWTIFFIWQTHPNPFTLGLFVLNSLIMTPLGFWMVGHFESAVLDNVSVKKDLRDTTKINQKHPLVKYLRTNFLYFFDNATSLAVSAAKLFFFIDRSKDFTKKQAEHSDEVNLSLQQMSTVIHQIAHSTELSKEQAQVSYESAATGVRQVEQNVEVMKELIHSIESINTTMVELKKSTGKISQVMDVIQGISNQTNMLSLNAAIEAAKAGEHGKGFAVVAEEVRNLANRTSQSTIEISNLIENIEKTTGQIVGELAQGTNQITQGREVAIQTKKIFDTILDNTVKNKNQAEEVAVAVEEQSRTIESVSASMKDLTESINNIYQNIEESASTARHLSIQGEDFMKFLLEYKLGNRASDIFAGIRKLGKKVEKLLEDAEKSGVPIWDTDYQVVHGSDPLKHTVKYLTWIDSSPLQKWEDELQQQFGLNFAVLIDKNGYLPKHNSNFDHPVTGEPRLDLAKSRSRRLFNDFTGGRAGKNTDPVLLQTYVRDTGEVLMDMSIPVLVKGKHWGGFRVGFATEATKM